MASCLTLLCGVDPERTRAARVENTLEEAAVLKALRDVGSSDPETRTRAMGFWLRHSTTRTLVEAWGRRSGWDAVVGTLVSALATEHVSLETVREASGMLAYYSGKDTLLRPALFRARARALPALMRIFERVTHIPESTACDIVDMMLTIIEGGSPTERDTSAALISRAWPVTGYVIAQAECCSMAAVLQSSSLVLCARILETSATPRAQVLMCTRSLVRATPESSLTGFPAQLEELFSRGLVHSCMSAGPGVPVPVKSALHLLHTIAHSGKANLVSFVAASSATLFSKLIRLAADGRSPAAVRVSAARFVYLVSVLQNEDAYVKLLDADVPATALLMLLPHANPPDAPLSAERAGLRTFASLTLRNMVLTPPFAAADGSSLKPIADGTVLKARDPKAPCPPSLPAGANLPALPPLPSPLKKRLWDMLTSSTASDPRATGALLALVSFIARTPNGLRALVATNGSQLEDMLASVAASRKPNVLSMGRRAVFLLWSVASERARTTSQRWAFGRMLWLRWRNSMKEEGTAEPAADAPKARPVDDYDRILAADVTAANAYQWNRGSVNAWKVWHTAEGWPYYEHTSGKVQWVAPSSSKPDASAEDALSQAVAAKRAKDATAAAAAAAIAAASADAATAPVTPDNANGTSALASAASLQAAPAPAPAPASSAQVLLRIGAPLQDENEGLFALHALDREKILRTEPTTAAEAAAPSSTLLWWQSDPVVRLSLGAIAAEALSEAPFMHPSGTVAVGDGVSPADVHWKWPHLPLPGASDTSLADLSLRTQAFLDAVTHSLNADTALPSAAAALREPLPLWLSATHIASASRMARSALVPETVALAALIVWHATTARTVPFEQSAQSVPSAAKDAFMYAPETLLPPANIIGTHVDPLEYAEHTDAAPELGSVKNVRQVLSSHRCTKSPFVEAQDASTAPLDVDVPFVLPLGEALFRGATAWQYPWEEASALSVAGSIEAVDSSNAKVALKIAASKLSSVAPPKPMASSTRMTSAASSVPSSPSSRGLASSPARTALSSFNMSKRLVDDAISSLSKPAPEEEGAASATAMSDPKDVASAHAPTVAPATPPAAPPAAAPAAPLAAPAAISASARGLTSPSKSVLPTPASVARGRAPSVSAVPASPSTRGRAPSVSAVPASPSTRGRAPSVSATSSPAPRGRSISAATPASPAPRGRSVSAASPASTLRSPSKKRKESPPPTAQGQYSAP